MKQALVYETPHFPNLPAGMVRDDVMKLLRALRQTLGISPARLEILDTMISKTDARAWTDPAKSPVCYARQKMVSEAAGYCDRAVRSAEAFFARLGLLEKRIGADGSRGLFGGGQLAQGLDFTPLIERIGDLLALDAERRAAIHRRDVLRRQCSSARRALSGAVAELLMHAPDADGTRAVIEALAGFPARYADLSESALVGLLHTTLVAVGNARSLIELQKKDSGVPEPGVRHHIHDKTHSKIDPCNGSSVQTRPARTRADAGLSSAGPNGPPQCLENKACSPEVSHKPKLTESFNPRKLYGIASDAFRFYLDAFQGDRDHLVELDFVLSAQRMLYELQVNALIWDEAVEVMGELRAALALLVIDARQHDLVRPIRSPGASLRTFIKLDRDGKLNLAGSLVGLAERQRNAKDL